jgi:hypothetical protein
MSGSKRGPALEEIVKHISSPVLLVAAGSPENLRRGAERSRN